MFNLQYMNEIKAVLNYSSGINPDLNALNIFLCSGHSDANDLFVKINYAITGAIKSGFGVQEAIREAIANAACYYLQYFQTNNIIMRHDRDMIYEGARNFLALVGMGESQRADINTGQFNQSWGYNNQSSINEAPVSGLDAAWETTKMLNKAPIIKKMSEADIAERVPMVTRPVVNSNSNKEIKNTSVVNNNDNNMHFSIITSASEYVRKYLNRRNDKGVVSPCPIYEVGNSYGLPPIFDRNKYFIQIVYKFNYLFIKLLPIINETIMNNENHRNFILSGYVINQTLELKAEDANIYEVDTKLITNNETLAATAQAMLIKEGLIENRNYSPFLTEDAPYIELIKERIVKLQTESLKKAIMETMPKEVVERKAGGVFNIPSTIDVTNLSDIPNAIRNIRYDNGLLDTSFIVKVNYKDDELISFNDAEAKEVCGLLCENDIGVNSLSKQMAGAKNNPFINSLNQKITKSMNDALRTIIQVGWRSSSFMDDYGELINSVAELKSPTNKFNRQIDDAIFNIFVRYIVDAIPRYEKVDAGYRCKDAYLFASVPLSAADLGFIQPTDATSTEDTQLTGYVNEETNSYLYSLCKNLDSKAQYNKIKRLIITSDNVIISIYAVDHSCNTYILVKV